MADITDKFGKASIDTDYAIATTVKTTRVSGAPVLEAFDLSKFSDDTPVFFVTYKKTTDPVTDTTTVNNLISWKGLVNVGANTITNLTLAPGYSDTGNAIGDFIECIPTSHWVNSLIEGIFVGHNPDGTLKTSAVQAALNISAAVPSDYTTLAQTATTVVPNGNRSYTMTFPGVNYTDRLSPGMRLRTVRSTPAPTQCASLNGTTQYYSKTSPAGMTFTDDFVVSAWVKISSYAAGTIISRYNGTSGWQFRVAATGQVEVYGFNAGAANYVGHSTYQSLPLNKLVHVVAQLDMSTAGVSTTTSYVMFDGVDVPVSRTGGGTNPTALIQAGNLEIGSANATNFFPGKIAQVAIFSAKVTQATMRGYMSQGLLGTETSLISAYSFNNVITDLNTTNANNLTANGGVLATTADSPFGGQADGSISATVDYGIIQKATYSAPDTTVVTQVAEGCTIPTSGGVASVSYSQFKSPYGFPAQAGKWRVSSFYQQQFVLGAGTIAVWYGGGFCGLTTPVGEWSIGYRGRSQVTSSATAYVGARMALSTMTNSVSHKELISAGISGGWNSTEMSNEHSVSSVPASVSASTNWSLLIAPNITGNIVYIDGASAPVTIYADCAYL